MVVMSEVVDPPAVVESEQSDKPRRPRHPNAIDVISREPVVEPGPDCKLAVLQESDAVARARQHLVAEDSRVKDCLVKMGCSEDDAELSMRFSSFQARHLGAIVGMTSAGVFKNFQEISKMLRQLEETVRQMMELGTPTKEMDLILRNYRGLAEESRETADMLRRSSFLLAKMDSIKEAAVAAAQSAKKKPKLGCRPKGESTTNIIAQNVTLAHADTSK